MLSCDFAKVKSWIDFSNQKKNDKSGYFYGIIPYNKLQNIKEEAGRSVCQPEKTRQNKTS